MTEVGSPAEGQAPITETPEALFERNLIENPRAAYIQANHELVEAAQAGNKIPDNPWIERGDRAWIAFATDMVGREVPEGGKTGPELTHEQMVFLTDMQALHNAAMFRPDGYASDHPSELSRRVAEKMIETDEKMGRGAFGPKTATEAKLPPERIAELRRRYTPTLRDMLTSRFRRPQQAPTSVK